MPPAERPGPEVGTPTAGPTREAADGLASDLQEQRQRVQALGRSVGDGHVDRTDEVLVEIDAAHDMLAAAERELRAQQDRLDALLARRDDPVLFRRSVVRDLPVPVVVTDAEGVVTDVNAAARALLDRRHDHVVDRPLAGLVHEADQALVAEVTRAAVDGRAHRLRLRLLPREGDGLLLDVVVSGDVLGDGTLTWVGGSAVAGSRDGDGARGLDPEALRTAEAFAEMCRLPRVAGTDTQRLLAHAALLVERAIPRCDGVSITLGDPERPDAQATDNRYAQTIDGAQLRAGDGPCLQAYRTGRTQVVDDLPFEPRWPELARLARAADAVSVLGVPVREERASLGVLNVYARQPGAFGERDHRVADLLVTAVLAVVQEVRDRAELTALSEQLNEALENRAVIERAKGVLMARDRLTADDAFTHLVRTSRDTNTKLREVARSLLEAHEAGLAPGPSDRS